MTVRERVQRTRVALEIISSATAILWGAAAAFAIVLAAAVVNRFVGIPQGALASVRPVAILAGIAVAAWMLWRARFAWAFDRVALWIEERAPQLRYALVTASEERYAASFSGDHILNDVDTDGFVRRAAIHSVLPAAAAVILALGLSAIIPGEWKESISRKRGSTFENATTAALLAGSRLTPLSAEIIPPAYTRLKSETVSDPSTLAAVQGSRIILRGPGAARGINAELVAADHRSSSVQVTANGDRWSAALVMADTAPALLELTDRNFKRAIVVNPRADAAPQVKLRLPARDTALRTAAGSVKLSADIADDIGLDQAQFEYIISSGAEETFTFKQGVIGAERFNGEKSGVIAVTVPYSFFSLGEGDRLSVRAVATDFNSISGPGKGFSETRTIRIARKDEYDSLSVEAAAPSGDTAMMSLRMLIIETEKLDAQRPKLEHDTLVVRSRALARQTDQVRAAVLPLFREEGGDQPDVTMDTESTERSVEVTSQVRAALNDLEDASRRLDVADPHTALPPMRNAYKALESFRNFKRYYFRGATRPVIVDIQRVRLSGKTKGTATPMSGRSVATSDRDRMRNEYSAAIEQIRTAPSQAVTMLTMLRVESLKKYPVLSAAIENALSAIGAGRDATSALLRVRRLLEGNIIVTDSLPVWSGGW